MEMNENDPLLRDIDLGYHEDLEKIWCMIIDSIVLGDAEKNAVNLAMNEYRKLRIDAIRKLILCYRLMQQKEELNQNRDDS